MGRGEAGKYLLGVWISTYIYFGGSFMTRISTVFALLTAFVFLFSDVEGQPVSLRGTIDADSGRVYLNYIGGDSYYRRNSGSLEAVVSGGKFEFRNSLAYPCAYQLLLKVDSTWKYISGIFILEPGEQMVRCHSDSMRETPDVGNAVTREQREWLAGLPDRRNDPAGAWKYRLDYVKNHPDSYVVLWDVIAELSEGYRPVLDSIYDGLSVKMKKSYVGAVLAEKLNDLRRTAIGKTFPALLLADEKGNKIHFPLAGDRHRYTLIDFWFSHCNPCIERFRQFKAIYAVYKGRDLEIAGISTDAQKYLPDWRAVIREEGFVWNQYLDEGGVVARRLSIDKYPTNFLLDERGVIIGRDITPEELKKLLDSPGSGSL
jgi:peroxiredoxin